MARPDPKAPGTGQAELFAPTETTAQRRAGAVLRGRHSVAMDSALDAARAQQITTPVDDGMATVLRAGAWALDSMESSGHHYGPAKLIPGLTEALRELHMTPESRQTDTDAAIADLLTDLAAVEAQDPANDKGDDDRAPVSDPEV